MGPIPQPGRPAPADPEVLLGREALGDAVERLRAAVGPVPEVAGWATVELDRAQAEVAGLLARVGLTEPIIEPAPDDTLLGARCRALRFADARTVLLLEPSTEGRLAAALARYGEGSVAHVLIADAGAPARVREAGFRLTGPVPGPFGPERLVLAGPRFGPFLVLAGLDRPGRLGSSPRNRSGRS